MKPLILLFTSSLLLITVTQTGIVISINQIKNDIEIMAQNKQKYALEIEKNTDFHMNNVYDLLGGRICVLKKSFPPIKDCPGIGCP